MNDQTARARGVLDEAFGDSGEPIAVVSAPGRVNLIGGHTDYNEGFVLPAGIDRRTVVAARPRDDRTVRVRSSNFDQTASFDLADVSPSEDAPWSNYVGGVAERLLDRGHDVGGTELAVVGDVPMGAGLSSSAAIEVAVGAALAAVHDLSLDDEELVTACWEAETGFVGLSCGIMDQYAAVHAERESALFLDCRDETHEVVPLPSEDVTVVATNTNVQRELVDSAYNDRVATCQEGVDFFDDALDESVESLRDVSVEAFEAHASELPETVRKRVRHVVTENERVREAAAALREGRLDRVGTLLDESHASLRDDYEVSIDELDAVASIADDLDGVFGSRMTGAGFGGCVVTLVRPDVAEDVTAAIDERYRDRTGIEPDVYVCNPDGGVRRHDR
ncbi:galactokinase [Halosimplex amylolyticum]|uniref:galactokinase n=1 Tax=Halosimplex amylolyticum TaxID=3396616 RepID=UPI003F5729F9